MAASRTVCRYARSLLAALDIAARRLFVGAPICRCPAPARHVMSVLYLSDAFYTTDKYSLRVLTGAWRSLCREERFLVVPTRRYIALVRHAKPTRMPR